MTPRRAVVHSGDAIVRKARATGYRVSRGDIAPQDRHLPLSSILDLGRTMTRGVADGRPAPAGPGRAPAAHGERA
ncbi:MAG: hypothetical protein A2V85_06700 [Chloroflexi bacterium RBG_16_72_14]|nr:MAG: hypothetical protein A2V85_06700 [Chloroflexi bacterium RBG_16_72_14]